MFVDWRFVLQEQSEIAQRLALSVPSTLRHPDMTLGQAAIIQSYIERGATAFHAIADKLQDYDVDDIGFAVIGKIEDIWIKLCMVSAQKMRSLQ